MSFAEPPEALPASACLLAFDTSTEHLALALQGRDGAGFTRLAAGGAAASAALLPQVHGLLAQARLTLADLDAVAFGRGPGAFTGLRTACAVAQGLGLGLARPLLPIDSLLIVAEDARAKAAPDAAAFEVGVAMDARMDEVYAARYRWQGGHWQVLQAPALCSLPALAEAWAGAEGQAVAGSALAAFGPRLGLPDGGLRIEAERDRAGALLRLAVQAARAGQGVDAAEALPLYLRDKVALTSAEREAVRSAATA
ncbi:MAG: tRNA (adenosine(37)-N6)-threonylcarbamoyltransferase complex dimerization subunit type 1 TsaB [Rubrivivax sp.]|jgi:tRNA threonylcarbamoyladenosine biosynthesis protein TsaB|nr:tRNA (adenosine(37)-N6)-threonylcarbamoyltransferase complex dimerization subunit type 1 TsaB [Betaproteobacteria bacterium]MBP6320182.1 tRNA (adenosine(37)-N6)-threonylcarbamoyltransferase complex dimerization subunit type 1 TsaB [Rubrivivax sp.]MBK7276390.1 tRNA (adenosine(37)-N6)-threonylcarbamoyltransferase complex dimerization subunit type 1 TsaB [Betaproteobacteria bacterium]MBL0299872.1 tRNA (adenosine(37)-N6)-threonylcarbamoyltransferase complex dimerization subunit type 1 TsaB [Betap